MAGVVKTVTAPDVLVADRQSTGSVPTSLGRAVPATPWEPALRASASLELGIALLHERPQRLHGVRGTEVDRLGA
jgi:hypothetical protein